MLKTVSMLSGNPLNDQQPFVIEFQARADFSKKKKKTKILSPARLLPFDLNFKILVETKKILSQLPLFFA
jgi:hypothetical protein